MVEKLVGKWKLSSSENFDEFMKKLGVGFMLRKLGNTLKPSLTIEFENGSNRWTMTSESTFKTTSVSFEINKEFDEETPDGRKVKSTVTIDGSKLVHTQRQDGKVICIMLREVDSNGDQICILKADDVEAKRVYRRA